MKITQHITGLRFSSAHHYGYQSITHTSLFKKIISLLLKLIHRGIHTCLLEKLNKQNHIPLTIKTCLTFNYLFFGHAIYSRRNTFNEYIPHYLRLNDVYIII